MCDTSPPEKVREGTQIVGRGYILSPSSHIHLVAVRTICSARRYLNDIPRILSDDETKRRPEVSLLTRVWMSVAPRG